MTGRDWVADALTGHGPGMQVWASVLDGSREVSFELGEARPGVPMREWVSQPFWCATKPILYHAVAAVAEAAGLGPSDDLDPLLPRFLSQVCPTLTLTDLGAHSTDLSEPGLAVVLTAAPSDRQGLAREALGRAGRPQQAYSEWLAWVVLEGLLEHAYRQPASTVLDGLLDDAGLYGVRFAPSSVPAEELGAWWGRSESGRNLPMLGHVVPSELDKLTPAIGGLASARGLGMWYFRLGRHLAGMSVPPSGLFPSPGYVTDIRAESPSAAFDGTLDRVCGFAAGMQYPLQGHGLDDTPAEEAIGQSGWLGGVTGFLDERNGVAACVFFNGVDFSEPQSIEPTRRDAVRWMYAELGCHGTHAT